MQFCISNYFCLYIIALYMAYISPFKLERYSKSQKNSSDANYHEYKTYAALKDHLTSVFPFSFSYGPVCPSEDVPGE